MVGWIGAKFQWRGLLAAVLFCAPALAQEPVAEAVEPVAGGEEPVAAVLPGSEGAGVETAPVSATEAPAAKKKKKGLKPESLGESPETADEATEPARTVSVFGRVYARASADEREGYARSLSIPSARVGVSAAFEHVEAEVSADLSSKSMLRDAFVRISDGDKRLRLYGGQFKSPFLARALESSWKLPIMRRGLVEDYLVETHQLGGRRLGLMGEVRIKEAWNLKVSGGLFEGAKDDLGKRTSEDAAARVSVRPFKALTLGVSSYMAQVMKGTLRHAVAADGALHLGGLELSGELVNGKLALGPFTAQLGLASYTVPLSGTWALQPVIGGEALQLRGDVAGRGWAAVGGLNILYSDSFKAQLNVERALRPGDEVPGLEYSLQLATRF
jgi:hypothetical protein